ncbi:MAG: hypothetical protein JZU47_13075 [Prolixibacteraceae bacterium]|nr:hypothetical protein [Prolixibacteraceae bacterium]
MKIELSDLREANQLIDILFSENSQPVYLIDESKKIRYSNPAFSVFLKKHPDEIQNRNFCETMDCAYYTTNDEPENPYCKTCRLDELIPPNGDKNIAVVRQFKLGSEICIKYVHFNTFEVQVQNEKLSMVLISDLTDSIQLKIESGEITGIE